MSPKVTKPYSVKKSSKGTTRCRLKLNDKLDIIRKIEQGVSRSSLMAEYNIGSSTLYDIKHSKHKLMDFTSSSEPNNKMAHRKSLHKPKLANLDKVLHEWFLLKRSQGMAISGPMLVAKAKDFTEKMAIDTSIGFSDGWLSRFKMRHGITKLDVAGKKQSETIVEDNNLTAEKIYDAEEPGCHLTQRTLVGYNEKTPSGFNHNKEKLTDIDEWIGIDNVVEVVLQTFSDNEIVDSVVQPDKLNDTFCSNSIEDKTEKVTWDKAEFYMEKLIHFFEHNPKFTMQEVMHAHTMRNIMSTKKQSSIKKSDIRHILNMEVIETSTSIDNVDNILKVEVTKTSTSIDDAQESHKQSDRHNLVNKSTQQQKEPSLYSLSSVSNL